MKKIQGYSVKLSQSPAFGTISQGMGGTMGLIMIGAVVQIICAIGGMLFGWKAGDPLYDILYMPYELTMGLLALFMSFTLAYTYAKRLGVKAQIQSGFTSMVCFILVCSPLISATKDGGVTIRALNVSALGANGIFVAILIGLLSVRITKFAVDHNWVIRMPDVVPEGILNSFNSIIPSGLNILLWYGISLLISHFTDGAMTLGTVITTVIATPLSYFVSPLGMVVIVVLFSLSWFFGLHGGSIVFTAIMPIYLAAYATNAELAAAGEPLVFNPVFLYGCVSWLGGAGNTLPLCVMGLKSKSKQISAVAKASLVPGLFNINEPVIFGFPIMYNPVLLIPFVLNSLVVMAFMYIAYKFNLMGLPHILIMTTLPIGLQQFMASLDWRNIVFCFLMFPVVFLIYYPFFKIYEKQCLAREAAEAAELGEE
ncbi:PTS sugar transporter subunit IIC [uncultured Dubosiella sp.]|uniref:PTS sugar transporter subunit IIC n=1 Tax=uncultured Dubosiella sp. TaxID=1937011 RepID=UPI00272F4F2C|nr:PTS transporter subunit EIIC [uncultured Dubosiella sp.]